jgi:DNA repair protein RecO (recombination protein O)
MSSHAAQAILLGIQETGEHDLLVTYFTRPGGKLRVLAKNARLSKKRFGGALDLFISGEIVFTYGRRGAIPILKEALAREHHAGIRGDISRTAHAAYWTELVSLYMEEGEPQEECHDLLASSLLDLHLGTPPEQPHLLFQARFACLAGFRPNLGSCLKCGAPPGGMAKGAIGFDIKGGGIVCPACAGPGQNARLGLGTVRQLAWVMERDLGHARRARFSKQAAWTAGGVFEAFLPYHLGIEPRSLRFLRETRRLGLLDSMPGLSARFAQSRLNQQGDNP